MAAALLLDFNAKLPAACIPQTESLLTQSYCFCVPPACVESPVSHAGPTGLSVPVGCPISMMSAILFLTEDN